MTGSALSATRSALSVARRLVRRGEPFLIHASAKLDDYFEAADFMQAMSISAPSRYDRQALPLGYIVGRAKIERVVTYDLSPWFFGPIGLKLRDIEPLPPRPARGALGFWHCDL